MRLLIALTSPIDGAVDPPVELMTPLPSIVTVEPSTLTPPRVPLAVTPAVGSVYPPALALSSPVAASIVRPVPTLIPPRTDADA